ncbi:tetratricopeptide repeat protein 19 homolog, mitochondrial [Pectinophora gossypiella]|uniref:MalT-like TPR region domain-containing protein n=1 Tax=Pectinophora gossypiella TaxID=13191 RepID=A0A1E1WDC5_PECGO|nr:tetratricopeptide repeat protein 19 homolog, mitochondrial [Pectinophora gossypiella]
MSTKFRFIWSRLSKVKVSFKTVPVAMFYKMPNRNIAVPATLGFSIFTWLGFDKKLSAEDELILTIKHCVLFIQRSEYEKAEQLLHIALRQAQQMQHELGVTYIYDVMANLALEREQLEKAKKLFIAVSQRIMAQGATEDDSRVVHLSVKLARISHLQKEYTTAQLGYDWCLQKLNNAFLQEPSDGIKKLIALTEDWYARLFLDCGKEELALKFMKSALDRMKEIPDVEKEHIVIQLNDIGTVCDKLGKDDESISYFQEAINLGKTLEMDDLGTMYINLGRVYLKKNLLDQARKCCGYGWRLGFTAKKDDIKQEAEACIKQINSMS